MHRHGYVGRKLGRERDERRRLVKNLATSLVLDEKITTTVPKAKELVPYAERLISKAIDANLHDRRQLIASLLRDDAAAKLVDEIAPQLKRTSGFLRLERVGFRRGDHAELATVSFVDELKSDSGDKSLESKTSTKPTPKKPGAEAKAQPGTKTASAKRPAPKVKSGVPS